MSKCYTFVTYLIWISNMAWKLWACSIWTSWVQDLYKVRKKAKIRNRYNQIPHLTQSTILESDKNTRKHRIQESQEFSSFPAGDHKAAMNISDSMAQNTNYKKDPQNKHRLGTVCMKITGELKNVWWYQLHPYFWCGSSEIDVWFALKIPSLLMYHLLVHSNTDIKMERRTQQYVHIYIQQLNPGEPDHRHSIIYR